VRLATKHEHDELERSPPARNVDKDATNLDKTITAAGEKTSELHPANPTDMVPVSIGSDLPPVSEEPKQKVEAPALSESKPEPGRGEMAAATSMLGECGWAERSNEGLEHDVGN